MLLVEVIVLCSLLFALCFLGTGTDEKNLKSFSSYPDVVQLRLKEMEEYRGKWKESNFFVAFIANFVVFALLFLIFGRFIRRDNFLENFVSLLILGEVLNVFDLVVIDLFWWRNTKRIRFSKIPEKALYQNPKKHVDAFVRGLVMYALVALLDGYLLTLF
ncbi:ABC transporter permease [Aedoeadaptatus coxii]|uniref:ABC transporter permease n=1 Tax=Aedoeadaptatus coxii TaxID=755172 RepID=UPI002AD41126|nr:ABC transporter permease [Peptoniphilus coxii]